MVALTAPRRRLSLRQLRLWTGLVIGVYVTMHLANHALGLISVDAQEAVRPYVMAFWHHPLGQAALYGSLSAHALLGLYALAKRRHFRMPAWERGQVLSGLAIPYLLLLHVVNTRGTRILAGTEINYVYEITSLWVNPVSRVKQVILVLLVWAHFVIGLHFWLRNKPWYRRAFAGIVTGYAVLPLMALLGFAEVGMAMHDHADRDPAWVVGVRSRGVPHDAGRAALRKTLQTQLPNAWLGLVAAAFVFGQVRNWRERKRVITVWYPREEAERAPVGMSILEVSRLARRPHLSVCGGRARCTTCRVHATPADRLPPPGPDEARALARINAPPGLRLACQLRPTVDVRVVPMVSAPLNARSGRAADFGAERQVTVLFVDLRDSTSLGEARMPFDVVFLVNQYIDQMATAVREAGGTVNNFTGDGLMALFGIEGDPSDAAGAAVHCAADMHARIDRMNKHLAGELPLPLRIGVGVNTGVAIVGRMGPPTMTVMTALGDPVNTAARLEAMTKEFGAAVVVSSDTLDLAGIGHDLPREAIKVRGRSATSTVVPLTRDVLDTLVVVRTSAPAGRGGRAFRSSPARRTRQGH